MKLTKVYQAYYRYPSTADDSLYYGGSYGELYANKEDCQKEIDRRLHPDLSYETFCKDMEGTEQYPSQEYYESWKEYILGDNPVDADIIELTVH